MAVASPTPVTQSRATRLALLAAVVAVLALLGWRAWIYAAARSHLTDGKALLDQDRPDEARGGGDVMAA